MRASDPLYEVAMALGGHRKEDKFWAATLTALGQRLGIGDPKVETRSTCMDSKRQWRPPATSGTTPWCAACCRPSPPR